ncbi:MAG: hypothetical protein V2I67_12965, partial [Thermoanaerobaculales bacterium]|nr:hypothetical protein [Thermoanaerobaculales bacterium]
GRRFGLGWPAALAVAVIWAVSPFTAESVFVVACRHELLLMIPWLALILVWPRAGTSWTATRLVAAGVAVLLAAAAKETWVVTPALVAALELERSRSWRSAVMPTVISTIAVVVYVGLYFAVVHSSKSYLALGAHVLAKLPNQLAAFFFLDELMVDRFTFDWTGGLATAAVVAIVASGVRWRVPGVLVATGLLIAPNIPTLAIPYMPQRYLTIPFAGFVLLVVLWGTELVRRMPRIGRVVRAVGYGAATIFIGVGVVVVRADLEDYRFVASAHRRLINEAAQVSPLLHAVGPVVVVRDEQTSPLHEVAASTAGQPKLFFVRAEDPYGLIDAAALFEWVRGEDGVFFEHVPDALAGVPGSVLIHQRGGFHGRGRCEDAAGEAIRWRDSGRGVRIVRKVDSETRNAGSSLWLDPRWSPGSESTGMAYLDRARSTESMVGGRPPDPTERSPS